MIPLARFRFQDITRKILKIADSIKLLNIPEWVPLSIMIVKISSDKIAGAILEQGMGA
jgi:hypothetical protein